MFGMQWREGLAPAFEAVEGMVTLEELRGDGTGADANYEDRQLLILDSIPDATDGLLTRPPLGLFAWRKIIAS